MKKLIYIFTSGILLTTGRILLQGDFIPFIKWWMTILVLGIIFLPLTNILFSKYHDRGYIFSKTLGIAITGYIMWFFASLRIMKFTTSSCIIAVIIASIINGLILIYHIRYLKGNRGVLYAANPEGDSLQVMKKSMVINKEFIYTILTEELIFLGLFLLFVYIRGFKPEAYGTEKFMDYGFMTSMMRSEYMPPQDFWFSGTNLNYYYVGQYMATFLTKLSFVKVSEGYNLMLMMVGAFAFVLPYSIVYNVLLQLVKGNSVKKKHLHTEELQSSHNGANSLFFQTLRCHNVASCRSRHGEDKLTKILPTIAGLLGGAGVAIAGNMHYPVYRWLEPAVRKFFGIEEAGTRYWFPDATRFIGYHPETNDKTIHEFPAYSFVLGDLHAHVVNIMFVITVVGILFGWMVDRTKAKDSTISILRELLHPSLILVGFFIGLFHTTNFWDFPIYYVVAGAVILFTNMIVYDFKNKAIWMTGLQGIFIMGLSWLISLPFTISFDQISTSIRLAVAHTPLNQLIILWGLPILMVVSFLCFLIGDYKRNYSKSKDLENGNIDIKKEDGKYRGIFKLFHFMNTLKTPDLFILILGLCAIGLVLIPEVIYVEDIYSGDYKRANTMFKLTYQAFILFGISFGYLFIRLIVYGETKRQKKLGILGLILFTSSLFYVGNATSSWYGNIFHKEGYEGLDASAFIKDEMPEDYYATNWLNENIIGSPVVLEANGDSYTDYQRVSVITGLPTVLGWHTHEWLWKSDPSLLDGRSTDIELIYTSDDEELVRELIKKYEIEYIYVGHLERLKYDYVNHQLIRNLGDMVFTTEITEDEGYGTYIVQVR